MSEKQKSCILYNHLESPYYEGYNLDEIKSIEKLYNIKVEGQLKEFFIIMGRCDGGVIGSDIINLYRPDWGIRNHLLFQLEFYDQMQESAFYDFLSKPFVIALISETQYYFLQTSINDKIYHYDSNEETVKETKWDLFGLLDMLYEFNKHEGKNKVKCSGDLLKI